MIYKSNVFNIKSNYKKSNAIILPISIDITTSYIKGTSNGPISILKNSYQIELFDLNTGFPYKNGIYMDNIPINIVKLNKEANRLINKIKKYKIKNIKIPLKYINYINIVTNINNFFIYKWGMKILNLKIIPIILGGEHGITLGIVKACIKKFPAIIITILHIDAHSDLRNNYQGFQNSHASIIYNIIYKIKNPKKILQLAIRELSFIEYQENYLNLNINTFFDKILNNYIINGDFNFILNKINNNVSKFLYLSFDIDGINSIYCPNTGTPSPGILSFNHIIFLIKQITNNKYIIGIDICENSNKKFDSIISSKFLYKIIGLFLISKY